MGFLRGSKFIAISAFAVTLLVASNVAWASPYTATVPFNCPQSSPGGPGVQNIHITVDPQARTYDLSEYRAFVERLGRDYPNVDYFSCLEEFTHDAFQWAYRQAPYWHNRFWNDKPLIALLSTLYSSMGEANTIYGAASYNRGATPPLEPAGVASAPLPLRDMQRKLRNDCGVGLNGSYLERGFLESLPSALESVDPECKLQIMRRYAQLLLDAQLDRKQCGAHPQTCLERRRAVARATTLLARAGLAPYDNDAREHEQFCRDPNEALFNNRLRVWANNLNATLSCTPVTQPGESADIAGNTGPGLTDTAYRLIRRPSVRNDHGQLVPSYEVAVDLHFTDGAGQADATLQKKYGDAARACYQKAEPFLRGPGGEPLVIKLASDEPANLRPSHHQDVAVVPADDARADSHHWTPDMDTKCPTILHETLHLLGLVDEYRERWRGKKVDKASGQLTDVKENPEAAQFNCRVAGPDHSIMSDQDAAFEALKPHELITTCYCHGPEGSAAERRCLRSVDRVVAHHGSSCPAGADVDHYHGAPIPGISHIGMAISDGKRNGRDIAAVAEPAERASLLYPAQFRAIVEPGCRNVNRTYYECASEAYTTSRGNYGSGGCSLGLPAACAEGGEAWLR